MPSAVIFDLDGVLMDSETLWNRAKEELTRSAGGRWRADAPRAMMGMSAPEWSAYLHDELGVLLPVDEINREVVGRIKTLYRAELPLLPGALDTLRTLRPRWPLGLASSSNREIIDLFVGAAGLEGVFGAIVSSEQVARGKPAPDVYLEAARRLDAEPRTCVAIEDSANGLRAAAAAGMTVIAVPNPHYPPEVETLRLAAARVTTIAAVTPGLIDEVGIERTGG